jgi:hypothetical protein
LLGNVLSSIEPLDGVCFVFRGRAFGGMPRFAGMGGIFQRISIASGFGWLTAVSLRALSSLSE